MRHRLLLLLAAVVLTFTGSLSFAGAPTAWADPDAPVQPAEPPATELELPRAQKRPAGGGPRAARCPTATAIRSATASMSACTGRAPTTSST